MIKGIDGRDLSLDDIDPQDGHPEALAFIGDRLSDHPHSQDPDLFFKKELSRPALPLLSILVPNDLWEVPVQGEHQQNRHLRHLGAVNPAAGGHDDLFSQRGTLEKIIDAGAQDLDPLKLDGLPEQVVGDAIDGHKNIHLFNMILNIHFPADGVEFDFREKGGQCLFVLIGITV
jgi:hypothetical protein